LASLNPPATREQIDTVQTVLELPLPSEFVESLLRHDGVGRTADHRFTLFADDGPLPVAEIAQRWEQLNAVFYQDPHHMDFEGDEFRAWDRRWLPVTSDFAGCLWVCDLRPGPRHGTFVYVDHDTGIDAEETRPSLASLLKNLADTLESGVAEDGSRPEVDEGGRLIW
jgi:cell wall assembly regulator SMI1